MKFDINRLNPIRLKIWETFTDTTLEGDDKHARIKMKEYIERNIKKPLTDALNHGVDILQQGRFVERMTYNLRKYEGKDGFYMSTFLRPFYEEYFFARERIHGWGKHQIREVISWAISDDYDFFTWVQCENNLLDSAHAWADYYRNTSSEYEDNVFLKLLKSIAPVFYSHCNAIVEVDEVRDILAKERKAGNPNTRAVWCQMYSFVKIWNTDISNNRKNELFQQLAGHWYFIKYLFSAMLYCPVDTGLKEFASITHNLKGEKHHPFIHLYYAAMEEHKEKIIQAGTNRYKLNRALAALREAVGLTPPSHELDELCHILFSGRFGEYLDRHAVKSYRELEEEVTTLRNKMDARTEKIQRLMDEQAEMLKVLTENSLSIESVTEELLKLDVGIAYGVYEKLNALLQKNETWKRHADNIHEQILQKMNKPNVQIYTLNTQIKNSQIDNFYEQTK